MHFRLERPVSTPTITVRCRLFARYEEVIGLSEVTLELPIQSTVADAVRFLRARVPRGEQLPARPLVAINMTHALADTLLSQGDELALLPPIAGG